MKIISYYLNSNFTCNKNYLLHLRHIMGTHEVFCKVFILCVWVLGLDESTLLIFFLLTSFHMPTFLIAAQMQSVLGSDMK